MPTKAKTPRLLRHAATSGNSFDLVRYAYTNGRPNRLELANVTSDLQNLNTPNYTIYYLQYIWHGDVVTWVPPDGNAINTVTPTYGPWGLYVGRELEYYIWNGGWGYLYFTLLKLYYVHGRWYNPETALWLSPNEKGDYLYGGDGPGVQDTINGVWRLIQAVNPNEMITGGIYQAIKNNVDATAGWGSLMVGPGVHNAYDHFFTDIEEGFPDTPSFRFG